MLYEVITDHEQGPRPDRRRQQRVDGALVSINRCLEQQPRADQQTGPAIRAFPQQPAGRSYNFV